MNFYCFSISWARILPNGTLDNINMAGINFYNNLINELLRNGIDPIVTMTRFDLPQAIQNMGGFTSEVSVGLFEAYANVLFKYFGDRVNKWMTFADPSLFCNLVYAYGFAAPTVQPKPGIDEYLCGHNLLKAHASAYRLYQKRYAQHQNGNGNRRPFRCEKGAGFRGISYPLTNIVPILYAEICCSWDGFHTQFLVRGAIIRPYCAKQSMNLAVGKVFIHRGCQCSRNVGLK